MFICIFAPKFIILELSIDPFIYGDCFLAVARYRVLFKIFYLPYKVDLAFYCYVQDKLVSADTYFAADEYTDLLSLSFIFPVPFNLPLLLPKPVIAFSLCDSRVSC